MTPTSMREAARQAFLDVAAERARRRHLLETVGTRHLSIIACNCWGGYFYQDLKLPYQTPFVGLYLHPPCFVGLLENFETAIRAPLEFIDESRFNGKLPFPIGLIMGAYEIHFMHYSSREEAREKWNRRRERIARDLDDCYFVLTHRGNFHIRHLVRFTQLPLRNKVLFTDHPVAEVPEAVVFPIADGELGSDSGALWYRKSYRYFDVAQWLKKE